MTCRIDRLSIEQSVVLRISGRMAGGDLDILRTALEEIRVVAIELAEVEMPGLMACREEFGASKPLTGARITVLARRAFVTTFSGVIRVSPAR